MLRARRLGALLTSVALASTLVPAPGVVYAESLTVAERDDAIPQVEVKTHATNEPAWEDDALWPRYQDEGIVEIDEQGSESADGEFDAQAYPLDALRMRFEEGVGITYRLRENEAWQSTWATDGEIARAETGITGLQVKLADDVSGDRDLWVRALVDEGGQLKWSAWTRMDANHRLETKDGSVLFGLEARLVEEGALLVNDAQAIITIDTAQEEKPLVVQDDAGNALSVLEDKDAVASERTLEVMDSDEDRIVVVGTGVSQMPARDDGAVVETEADVLTAQEVAENPAPAFATSVGDAMLAPVLRAQGAAWARVAGENRYETMQKISQTGFGACDWAVVAAGSGFPDALSASALAGMRDCPVLLTASESLSSQARSELERLGVKHVYLMGGESTLSGDVQSEIADMGIEVVRVAGANRIETSLAVLRTLATEGAFAGKVVIASGQSFPDALSISPYSYVAGAPILLTAGDGTLTEAEAQALLNDYAVSEVTIVGGSSSVSGEVETLLSGLDCNRLSGSDRYATSADIARFETARGFGWGTPYVATGKSFPDALAGGALAGHTRSVLLVADSAWCDTIKLLAEHEDEMDHGIILGGKASFPMDDPLATYHQAQATGKLGYQNPAGFYQVSSKNVEITSEASYPFNYITPSRIDVWATREDCVEAFIERAYEYLGTPYVWDYSCAPGVGVNCIGLVFQCAYACGMDMGGGTSNDDFNPWAHYITGAGGWHSHDANNFWDYGKAMHVSLEARQRGDVLSWPGHVGIYIGDDLMIEAYSPATGVFINDIWAYGIPRGCIRLFQ